MGEIKKNFQNNELNQPQVEKLTKNAKTLTERIKKLSGKAKKSSDKAKKSSDKAKKLSEISKKSVGRVKKLSGKAKKICKEYQELTDKLNNVYGYNLKSGADYLEINWWENFENNTQNYIKQEIQIPIQNCIENEKSNELNSSQLINIEYLIKSTIENTIEKSIENIQIKECPVQTPNKYEYLINIAWSGDDEPTNKVVEILTCYMNNFKNWTHLGTEVTDMMGSNEYINKFNSICLESEFNIILKSLQFVLSTIPGASELSVDVYGKKKS